MFVCLQLLGGDGEAVEGNNQEFHEKVKNYLERKVK